MTLPNCRTCRFAVPLDGQPDTGICHRNPPIAMPTGPNGEMASSYNVVVGLDKPGCGEHKPNGRRR